MGILGWYAEGLLGTLLMEVPLAFALGIRSPRGAARMALIQVLTNPLVLSVVSLAMGSGVSGAGLQILILGIELLVVAGEGFLIEALVPSDDLVRCRLRNPWLLALALNAFSFLIGSPVTSAIRSVIFE